MNVKVILGEDTTDISINIGESKYLINAYYLKTIVMFFEMPNNDDEIKR